MKELKIKDNGLMQYVLYFVFGCVASFGFAPFYFWLSGLIGIAGAYYLAVRNLDSENKSRFWKSLLRVWPFGAGYAALMFWWVLNSIYVVPELARQFAVWTAPGIFGIALGGGIVFAIPFVLIRCMRPNHAHRAFLFASFWTLVLWLREWLLSGFPWNPVANIAINYPIVSNSMSLWGAIGLTFVIIGLIASAVDAAIDRKRGIIRFAPLIVFVSLFAVGLFFGHRNIGASKAQSADSDIVVRIVQPARSASDKATHSRAAAVEKAEMNIESIVRLATLDDERPDVIIFPETSYPYLIADDNLPFVKRLNVPVIIGAMSYKDGNVYNSMAVSDSSGKIKKLYSKSHLVPFGEYRPFGDIIPTPGLLTPGLGPEIITMDLNGREFKFAPAICYEIIFSDSLVPRGSNPSVVVNITNDAWFGKTPGTYQHLDMVRRYAIESGLPVIRSNYSGISAFVNSDGAVMSQLPIGEAGAIDGVAGRGRVTIYRHIGRDMWMIIILLFSAVCVLCTPARPRKD